MFSSKTKKAQEKVDHEKLGKAVEAAVIKDYIRLIGSTRQLIISAFIRGIFTGLGGVIGATVVVALLLWFLSLAGGVPVVGEFFRSLGDSIKN